MERGDISNEAEARCLVIFDGLLASLPQRRQKGEAMSCRLRRWEKAVDAWEIHDKGVWLLHDLTWRYHTRYDIACFRPRGFAQALRPRLDEMGLAYGAVYGTKVESLTRALAHMPYILTVFDADPDRQLTWGRRGMFVPLATTGSLF